MPKRMEKWTIIELISGIVGGTIFSYLGLSLYILFIHGLPTAIGFLTTGIILPKYHTSITNTIGIISFGLGWFLGLLSSLMVSKKQRPTLFKK